jgi:uncharacterized protein YjbJ (UPF0337 family)
MDKDRIAGAAKDAAGKVEGAFGHVTGDTSTEASGRAREAAGTVQNAFGQAKDAARDLGSQASEAARDVRSAASDFAQNAFETGSDYYRDGSRLISAKVKEQPLSALLTAGVLGFALGIMMTRQPRRRSFRDYYR